MLRDIADLLRPGGRIFVDTGAGDDWLDRLLPGRVQWYDPPQHLFVFPARVLSIALENAGSRVERFDSNFERNSARRLIKTLRNGTVATGFRVFAEVGRTVQKDWTFVRFPMGNLISATAVKLTGDASELHCAHKAIA